MITTDQAKSALRDLIGLIPIDQRNSADEDINIIIQLIVDYNNLKTVVNNITNIVDKMK